MNLGNKLAVGEAVDLGIDEVTVPETAAPAPVEAVAAAPSEPVAAHAER